MKVAADSLQKNAVAFFAGYLPEQSQDWPLKDILSYMKDYSAQKQAVFEKTPSAVFNDLVFCFPREAKWDLVSFVKDDSLYNIRILFGTPEQARSFLKSAHRMKDWTLLSGTRQTAGEVILEFKVRNE